MPRRRSNLSTRTISAQIARQRRANESEEERQIRLQRNREQLARSRSAESSQQREERLEAQRRRSALLVRRKREKERAERLAALRRQYIAALEEEDEEKYSLMEKEKDRKKIINIDLDGDGDDEVADDDDTNDSNSENSNLPSDTASTNTSTKKNRKITKAVKDILSSNNTKFMSNFDPELSNRERRKLTRKLNADGKKNGSLYDESGILNGSEKDICDCLNDDCPGCHFPCPKCRSCKCGVECRVSRKWVYEAIENEGDVRVTKNVTTASA